jgi:chromosome segregation ATPase
VVLQEQASELKETKQMAKQAIESLVAQNRLFLSTIAQLQNQVAGLRWSLKAMEGQMASTSKLLQEHKSDTIRLKKVIGGKHRAHAHKNAAEAAFDNGLVGVTGGGYTPGDHRDEQAKSKSVRLAVSEILLGACGSESKVLLC